MFSIFQHIPRWIFLILALTIFLHSTHLGELGKLPFLLKHYSEHQVLHPEDSFADFLYKHYIQDQKAESAQDSNSDKHLPFKAHTFHFDLSPFIVADRTAIPMLFRQQAITELPYIAAGILSRAGETWHPPKIG